MRNSRALRYLLIGMGVGGGLALMFAPKSGKETREYLFDEAKEAKRFARRRIRDLRASSEDIADAGRHFYRRIRSIAA